MKINSILSTKGSEVISIRPDQSISEVVTLLGKHNIGALVVADDAGSLLGIISERDIIRTAAVDRNVFTLTVSEVMTKRVVVGLPEDDVISVAHTMTEKRFRHLPIVEGDRLVGMISIGDILKAQRDQYMGEIDTLETQILADEE
jgi:CBS domain-containing protein